MDWVIYVFICIAIALATLIVIGYIRREFGRHLIFWSSACVTYFLSYASILGLIQDANPVFARVVHPVLLALSGLFVLRGVLIYLDRAFSPFWVCLFGLSIAWVFLGSFVPELDPPLLAMIPRLVVGLAYFWISIFAISRAVSDLHKGSRMIGAVFIIWGALNILMAFSGIAPHGYLIDGFLGLTAAVSFLLLAMNSNQILLLEEERKFRALFANANDAIFLGVVGEDGRPERLLEVNEEAELLLGYGRDELLAMDRRGLESIGLNGRMPDMAGPGAARLAFETMYVTRDGERVPVEVSASTFRLHDKMVNISIARDIAERKRAEERIQFLALHDALTGLCNRVLFDRELRSLSVAANLPLSLIMADLNGLKLTNDLFGHDKGDALLVAFGEVLRRIGPADAVASRWGGDEFVLLLPKTDEHMAKFAAAQIILLCDEVPPTPMGLSVALGVATAYEPGAVAGLLKTAEDRMYRHKFLEQRSTHSFTTRFMRQALEEKSQETEGHCERLQRMSAEIGLALGLNDSQIDDLSLVAVLHDIGKLTIPDHILAKPGRLTEEEYGLIKGHSEIGFKIALASPELSSIAKCILFHHERWDGRGYPNGLRGEEVPLYSRIVAVADAYDAMVSRKGLPIREAMAELHREAGAQFDPRIVKVFLALLDEGENESAAGGSPEGECR